MSNKNILAIILFLCLQQAFVFAQVITQYPKVLTEFNPNNLEQATLNGVEFLADKEGLLSIEDVMKPPYLSKFDTNTLAKTGINAYWYRFRIKNTSDTPIDVSIGISLVRDFTAYIFDGSGKYRTLRNGFGLSMEERPEITDAGHIHLRLTPQEENTIYIRSISDFLEEGSILPLRIHSHDDRVSKQRRATVFIESTATTSVLLVMAFYNLMLFLFIRDRVYLYYTLAMISAVFYFIGIDGLSEYLFGVRRGDLLGNYAIIFMSAFLTQFTRHYYKTSTTLKKWDLGLKILNILLLCFFISYFFESEVYPITVFAVNITLLISIIYSTSLSIYSYRKGIPAAKYYLISMAFFFVFAVYYLLQPSFINLLPASWLGSISLKIGFLGQLLLFSLALAARINILREEINQKKLEAEKIEKENILKVQNLIKEKNIELEETVTQRTEELKQINEELNQTIEELDSTNETLKSLNQEISRKNNNILASITYASRIQQAMLPFPEELQRMLGSYFLLYQPKDLVSGDFYWIEEKHEKVFIVAADCTGHGVPGAFMSMIGNELLNQIIINQGVTHTATILSLLHEGIRKALQQEETNNRDGMDMALVVWDKKQNTLQFSGAHNPIILIQNGKLQQIKGGAYSIGGLQMEKNRVFETHNFDLNQIGDTYLYMFSDGYQDQFGGELGGKFMRKRFKELLLEIYNLPITAQEKKVKQVLNDWVRDKYEQTDDILLMGIHISAQKT